MKYTEKFSDEIEKLKWYINDAQAIVIGAGAGLSTSAGFTYSGRRFHENFHDFETKYNFHDMYTGGFYPYSTLEEYWAYWSRYVFVNRYSDAPKPVYEQLFELVKDKNCFIITTNVDHCFQKAGFSKDRLFYTQGDYGLFQCSEPCHAKSYDNEDAIRRMVAEQKDMKVPAALVPRCPICGKPMSMNLRADDTFVEDDGWHEACLRYEKFVLQNERKKILYLELGVGMNTPAIIKYPFWRLTAKNRDARYVCVNVDAAYVPREIESRSLCISCDISDVLNALSKK